MSAELSAITMPKWGLAMTEGKLTAWLADVGASLSAGDSLVEIETSKIANEFEAPASGTLLRQVAAVGETICVGDLMGVMGAAGTSDADVDAFVEKFRAEFVPPEKSEDADAGPAFDTATVGGKSTRYLRMGDAGGTPMLLIHGYGGDINNWMFNQPPLSAKRTVYALDLPGHGGSTKDVDGVSIADQAAFVSDFMDAVGLAKAHLAGHSMGGAICLALALAAPQKVASITLICSAGLGDEINTGYTEGFVNTDKRKDLKPVLELLFANPSLVTRDMIDDVLKYKRLDGVSDALRRIGAACFAGGKQTSTFAARLGEIKAPVHAIWGEADAIIPAAHAHKIAVNHILPATGHMVHLEAANEVNELIEAFLAKAGG